MEFTLIKEPGLSTKDSYKIYLKSFKRWATAINNYLENENTNFFAVTCSISLYRASQGDWYTCSSKKATTSQSS